MGRQKDLTDRCLGPYYDAAKATGLPGAKPYYVIYVEGGKKERKSFTTQKAAQRAKDGYDAELEIAKETTVEQLLGMYEDKVLRTMKKNLPGSYTTTMYRLNLFFGPVLKMPAAALTEQICRELREGRWKTVPGKVKPVEVWKGLATRELPRKKKPATATSQLNIIDAVRTFTKRMVGLGHMKTDPMAWFDPDMDAYREHGGKGQSDLSFSQAEKVLKTALEIAEKEAGRTEIGTRAAATFVTLMTGLRASTIAGLSVSSIDRRKGEAHGEPWILRAPQAKKRGRKVIRPYGLPAIFEGVLGPLCEGRPGDAPLFYTGSRLSAAEKIAIAEQYGALDKSRGSSSRLTAAQLRDLRAKRAAGEMTVAEIAKEFGLTERYVFMISGTDADDPTAVAAATRQRINFLRAHGVTRQQVNRWQRGELGEDAAKKGHHRRDWVRRSVGKICLLAGVPVETAHALRGVLASKLTAEGYRDIAQWLLGHVRGTTTEQSYASAESVGAGRMKPFIGILNGGKR